MKYRELFEYYKQELKSFHDGHRDPYYPYLIHAHCELEVLQIDELISFAKFLYRVDYYDDYDKRKAEIENRRWGKAYSKSSLEDNDGKRDSGFFRTGSFWEKLIQYCDNAFADTERAKICFCCLTAIAILEKSLERYTGESMDSLSRNDLLSHVRLFQLDIVKHAQARYSNDLHELFEYFEVPIPRPSLRHSKSMEVSLVDFGFAVYLILATHNIPLVKRTGDKVNFVQLCQYIGQNSSKFDLDYIRMSIAAFSSKPNPEVVEQVAKHMEVFIDSSKKLPDCKEESMDKYVRNTFDFYGNSLESEIVKTRIAKSKRFYPDLVGLLDKFCSNYSLYLYE